MIKTTAPMARPSTASRHAGLCGACTASSGKLGQTFLLGHLVSFIRARGNDSDFEAAFFLTGVVGSATSFASLARRRARKRSVFAPTARASASYSIIALAPSLARSSFLKLASARRCCSESNLHLRFGAWRQRALITGPERSCACCI